VACRRWLLACTFQLCHNATGIREDRPVLSQQNISPQTPTGATLIAAGATFKV
jgi:hypothetical protein